MFITHAGKLQEPHRYVYNPSWGSFKNLTGMFITRAEAASRTSQVFGSEIPVSKFKKFGLCGTVPGNFGVSNLWTL